MVEKSHASSSQIRRSWNFASCDDSRNGGQLVFRDTLDPKDFVTSTRILAWPFLENHVHGFGVESIGLRWGDSEAVRGLHPGHRQGNSKKGGRRLKDEAHLNFLITLDNISSQNGGKSE